MTVETLNNQQEDLTQETLAKLKEQLDIIPGKIKYIKESKDKKYNIYAYKLVQGGTKGGIKNKYIQQIGNRIEGTQFTDAGGREITKDRFNEGEIVYLRVPKQDKQPNSRETNNNAGTVEFVKNYKDTENKDWKIYKYTFIQGGNLKGVKDKYDKQIGYINDPMYLCNTSGDKLSKSHFDKGETIYFKVPNVDIVNSTPEMNLNDIMNLSDNDIMQLFDDIANTEFNNIIDIRKNQYHYDKKGPYFIINGKKVYDYGFGPYLYNKPDHNTTYITYIAHESMSNLEYITITKQEGNKYSGVYYSPRSDNGQVYRGDLKEYGEGALIPEGYTTFNH